MTSIGPVIGTSLLSSNYTAAQVDSEQGTATNTYNPTPATFNMVLGGTANNLATDVTPEMSYGLFTFGKSLTLAQLSTYGAMQTTLITALLAA